MGQEEATKNRAGRKETEKEQTKKMDMRSLEALERGN